MTKFFYCSKKEVGKRKGTQQKGVKMQITLENIENFHKAFFNKATGEIQELKLLQEIAEFQTAINTEEKIEEAVDIIISAVGFLSKMGCNISEEVNKKLEIIQNRKWDEKQFNHIEEKEKLVDEW